METECLAPHLNATLSLYGFVFLYCSASLVYYCYLSVVMSSDLQSLTQALHTNVRRGKHKTQILTLVIFFYRDVKGGGVGGSTLDFCPTPASQLLT